mmetsp:Transcript_55416/g.145437  ORF Transcript_55416/g.145437 Transcript_55416/m.145437 type:complete len:182 (-) Transcript_55416:194-739(-)
MARHVAEERAVHGASADARGPAVAEGVTAPPAVVLPPSPAARRSQALDGSRGNLFQWCAAAQGRTSSADGGANGNRAPQMQRKQTTSNQVKLLQLSELLRQMQELVRSMAIEDGSPQPDALRSSPSGWGVESIGGGEHRPVLLRPETRPLLPRCRSTAYRQSADNVASMQTYIASRGTSPE